MAGENKGWISLHRSIQDNVLWEDKPFSKGQAWVDLLLLANHKEGKTLIDSNVICVNRGELITSIRKLCDRWGWSNKKLKRFLDVCVGEQMLSYKSDTKKTTINIVNYSLYQGYEKQESTTEAPQKHNRSITEAQQKHTNNNDNNDNNDNKYENPHTSEALELATYFETLLPGKSITAHLATLNIWLEIYKYDWVKEAIQKCVSNKNKFIKSYIDAILKNWAKDGKEEYKAKSSKGSFTNYDQRNYDFDDLEKKLLGWDK